MRVKIYVEGGGDQARLKRECRRAFSKFFEKAGFKGRMPRVVACGSRNDTYGDFCIAVRTAGAGELPMLLVDSEEQVAPECCREEVFKPWHHLQTRDGWTKPVNADDEQAHLMVQCMEAWFLTDHQCLEHFFGQHFQTNCLPDNHEFEAVDKARLFAALKNATRHTKKGEYGKGAHSFKLLESVNPERVFANSRWAARLRCTLENKL